MRHYRVLALGIDALDPDLVMQWAAYLPNLTHLKEQGGFSRTCSTFPADSVPAWTTIYTGRLPSDHGILDETEYLDFRAGERSRFADVLRGNTFWDVAGERGARVCVVNPFLAYPVWPVNGVMVGGPVFVTGETQSFPSDIKDRLLAPELGGMVDFPSHRELPAFVARARQVTQEQMDYARKLWAMERWDLCFVCLLTLDRVQHFLWRYSSIADPTYPGKTPLADALRDFYVLIDDLVGEMLSGLESDVMVVIFSDHGHGMRPPRQVFVNEWLRRSQLLKTQSAAALWARPDFYLERAKRLALSMLHRLDLEDVSYLLARLLPRKQRKALKHSSYTTSQETSLAWLASLGSGTHTGGIALNTAQIERKGLSVAGVERQIIEGLSALRDPADGRLIFRWVRHREEHLDGPRVSVFPDLVFELEDDYAVDATLYCGLVGNNPVHRRISGGHRDYGTFIVSCVDDSTGLSMPSSVADIRPYLLGILGMDRA